jgi:hypothetical protein
MRSKVVNAQLKSLDPPDMQPERGGFLDGLWPFAANCGSGYLRRTGLCGLEAGAEFALLARQGVWKCRK